MTTLAEALEAHLSGWDGRSDRTVGDYRYALAPTGWTGEIKAIRRDRVGMRERHRALARDPAPTADSVMRVLWAVYTCARREHPDLPQNPCETSTSAGPAGAPGPTSTRRPA